MMRRTLILLLILLSTFSFAQNISSFMNVFVVPDKELIVMQCKNLNTENLEIELTDSTGKSIQKTTLYQGSTIAYFDTQTLYSGAYTIHISNGTNSLTQTLTLQK